MQPTRLHFTQICTNRKLHLCVQVMRVKQTIINTTEVQTHHVYILQSNNLRIQVKHVTNMILMKAHGWTNKHMETHIQFGDQHGHTNTHMHTQTTLCHNIDLDQTY